MFTKLERCPILSPPKRDQQQGGVCGHVRQLGRRLNDRIRELFLILVEPGFHSNSSDEQRDFLHKEIYFPETSNVRLQT